MKATQRYVLEEAAQKLVVEHDGGASDVPKTNLTPNPIPNPNPNLNLNPNLNPNPIPNLNPYPLKSPPAPPSQTSR